MMQGPATQDSIERFFRKLGPLSWPWECDLEAGFKGWRDGLQWIAQNRCYKGHLHVIHLNPYETIPGSALTEGASLLPCHFSAQPSA